MSTMTLQDVADLAKVRRPVVSMWRKRPRVRGVSMPFPDPVGVINGAERFAPADVVDWLRRTRRGKNPDAELDALAIAAPDGVDLEDVVTLLAWHVLTGAELGTTTSAERTHLAAEFDPDDALLLREVRTHQPDAAALTYIDDLVAASYGPSDALVRAERGRLKRELAQRELTADAVKLLSDVTAACVVFMGSDGLGLRTDGTSVSLEVAAASGLSLVSADRAVLRRGIVMGVGIGDRRSRAAEFASAIGLAHADVLDRADDLVVRLEPGDAAVLVGPAAALTDTLAGELQGRRADVLRVGNVVAAIRLPRGMWREAHRQNLAVWVCLGGAEAQRPWVADLAAAGPPELRDLAADVAGALSQSEGRAYRYMRRIELASVLASGPVVPRGVQAAVLRSSDPAGHLHRVHSATLTTTALLEPLDVLVDTSPGRVRLRSRSLGELHDQKHVVVMRGRRIDPVHASPDGTVRVLPIEVAGDIVLDPFDAERWYPRAVRTDPGDVVFVEKPQPRAWVDAEGGAMVASPARVLRLTATADFGPRLLATVINDASAAGSEWHTWSVPVMTREESGRLEVALDDVERYEAEALRRAEAAKDLKKALIDGVAAGALTLDAQPTTPGVAAAPR
ncbi:hypothetical protein [Mycolicibacterium tusciae]|uniref:hypothetical protein n=1 Tax=Mycolicibacterium tusciae TaxID=75922 RepID=UPI00024A22F9|nr:hypothetical protein [Mycolicibacterium tusciae]